MSFMLKITLKVGAVLSALVGIWVLYVAIINVRDPESWKFAAIVFQLLVIGFALTPGIMLLAKCNTKRWQLIVIGVAEVIIIGFALLAALAFFRESVMNQITSSP
jgi:hypothetical protein